MSPLPQVAQLQLATRFSNHRQDDKNHHSLGSTIPLIRANWRELSEYEIVSRGR
jgi:hypothetical protein